MTTDFGSLTCRRRCRDAARARRLWFARPEVLLAVGDVASCYSPADEAVADLASRLPGTIALLGDTAYESGTTEEYANCFDPAWGPMKSRIRPATGNHEYQTKDAKGYFDYFGTAAGPRDEGWYSYDLGAWHIVVLNSNCGARAAAPMDRRSRGWRATWPRIRATACLATGTTRAGAPAATVRRTSWIRSGR